MKKYMKPISGVILILIVTGFIIFWETEGRDAVMLESVIVAKEDIPAGILIKASMFKEIGIIEENMISNGIKKSDILSLEGKVSKQIILKNTQISKKYFFDKKSLIKKGEGIFQLKEEWIFSISSSIRKNDIVDIYLCNEKIFLGSFVVAFVKDNQGAEVLDEIETLTGADNSKILNRKNGSAVVKNIEIISTLEKYSKIIETMKTGEEQLIIVNREE